MIDACDPCLRRTWLLATLSPYLDVVRDRYGRPDELLTLADGELIAGLGGRRRCPIRASYEAFDGVPARRRIDESGMHAVCRHAAAYPRELLDSPARPSVLHVMGGDAERQARGEGPAVESPLAYVRTGIVGERPRVAIVGARRASEYGREVARSLGRSLAAAGVPVVSGMAFGVDAAAHEGALDAGGATVAVLGGGADVAYPRSQRRLHERLSRRGLVVSELPPGFAPRRWCFPARNRVIAALAELTVVVEGTERSGALITARIARDMGREVGAVPGRITAPVAAGPNALLYDGAHVIRDAQDALDVVFGAGVRRAPSARDPAALAPDLRRLFGAVSSGRDTLDGLAADGFDLTDAMTGLAELELRGFVRRGAGGVYTATA